jgi:[acyl-carrier-protein] S-malonyltransferase
VVVFFAPIERAKLILRDMRKASMGRVAYLFPGQGSQEVGMGCELAARYPDAAEAFERADDALGFKLSTLVAHGPSEALALTEHTQPAVLVASIAALRAAQQVGLPAPDFVAGHSLGEYSALVAAGVLGFEDAVRAVRLRGRFMQAAVPVGEGAMAAVLALSPIVVTHLCAEIQAENPGRVVVAANLNAPEQVVIAGHADAVKLAGDRCLERGARRVVPLEVSAPFHSPLMRPVQSQLSEVLSAIRFFEAQVPLVTNVEGRPEIGGDRLRALLIEQVVAPVRWTEVLAHLAAEGCDTFIELGPGAVLSGLVRRQLPGSKVLSISHPAKLEAACAALAA